MPRAKVGDLYVSCVDMKPISFDFRENEHDYDGWGDGEHGWQCWEAHDCPECGESVVVHGLGSWEHRDLVRGEEWEEPCECAGDVYAEGPMMNYLYLLDTGFSRFDPEEAACKIAHLPLCVVEWQGDHYLALTGGGMDLSWEICEAYMCLGYLPPAHFASVPKMCGRGASRRDRWILGGCRRSFRVQRNWATSNLRSLRDTARWSRNYRAERGAALV